MRERLVLHGLCCSLKTPIKPSASTPTPRPNFCTAAVLELQGEALPPPFQLRVPTVTELGFSLFLGKYLQDSFNKKKQTVRPAQALFKANHQLQLQQQTGDSLGLWNKSGASVHTQAAVWGGPPAHGQCVPLADWVATSSSHCPRWEQNSTVSDCGPQAALV